MVSASDEHGDGLGFLHLVIACVAFFQKFSFTEVGLRGRNQKNCL